jgi:putative DNA primase/helicase
VDICRECGAALLGITHFTKGSNGREPIERITGSVAFGAIGRVVLVAAKEASREDGTLGGRFLARAKSNIGPDGGGFSFELKQTLVPNYPRIVASIAKFGGAIEGSARELLQKAEAEADDQTGGSLREAMDFLKEELSGGPRLTKKVCASAKEAGISSATLKRARQELGVISRKANFGEGWLLSLAEEAQYKNHEPLRQEMSFFAKNQRLHSMSHFEEGLSHFEDDEPLRRGSTGPEEAHDEAQGMSLFGGGEKAQAHQDVTRPQKDGNAEAAQEAQDEPVGEDWGLD